MTDQNQLLREALQKIADIQNEMYGGDWDEIEKARQIAIQALAQPAEGGEPEGWQFRVLSPGSITVQNESGYTCTLWKSGHGGVESLAYQMADMLRKITAAMSTKAGVRDGDT